MSCPEPPETGPRQHPLANKAQIYSILYYTILYYDNYYYQTVGMAFSVAGVGIPLSTCQGHARPEPLNSVQYKTAASFFPCSTRLQSPFRHPGVLESQHWNESRLSRVIKASVFLVGRRALHLSPAGTSGVSLPSTGLPQDVPLG